MKYLLAFVLAVTAVFAVAETTASAPSVLQGMKPIALNVYPSANGERLLSMDLKDAEIIDVIKAVAKAYKYNVIADESVKGKTITIKLMDISVEDALDSISEFLNLSYDISGGTIMIDSLKNVREQGKFKKSERISLKYIDATEAKEALKSIILDENSIQINKTTNELIINDLAVTVRKARRALENIDRQPVQVMLEAKIIEVASSSLKEYGFNWSTQGNVQASTDGSLGVFSAGSASITGLLNILETKGKAKIIANPRVATLNNKTATLEVSDKVPVPVRTVDTSGRETITVTYENVGVSLKITPQINDNDFITLNIKPKVSSIVEFSGPNNDWPRIASREVETLVRVKNGETIVIGGLNKDEERISQVKVPILGDIPLLGALFTSERRDTSNTEVIILVMPKIIK